MERGYQRFNVGGVIRKRRNAMRVAGVSNERRLSICAQAEQVNQLQLDAKEAIEDVVTGRRDDLESVMIATQKADTAFRSCLSELLSGLSLSRAIMIFRPSGSATFAKFEIPSVAHAS